MGAEPTGVDSQYKHFATGVIKQMRKVPDTRVETGGNDAVKSS